ncbi:LysR family transcriptional regulator [Microlunatus antarcticus]|uniref:DNA-binding transcriptional LysR family regulator n=1 Tax=Microlunatus antarcticus TaxID=53388 RepID=A0A7W5JUR4_9ACTN|nr:LysR family transcriptional regulator [Microlunatus antarcticus]MBB3326712.1 DNA-binding transcriptional LysR family regulator [Microlunatus antarcticus]
MTSRYGQAVQIRDLGWLVTVADHQHVSSAADALGTSQPTLSRALARCEAELGARLFERVPDGVRLTPAGALVVDAARDLTSRWTQLTGSLARVLDSGTGLVRLAFLDSMATSLVPSLLRAFHAHAPQVRVQLRQEPGHEIARDFGLGAVDLAVTSAAPEGPYGWHVLQQERLVLVVPGTHAWRGRTEVALAELGSEELITTPAGFGHRQLVDGLLRQAGVAPSISFESQDLATIEGLVAAGLGVAVVPEAFAGHSGTVGLRLTAAGARRTIGLTWRTDRELTPPAQRFLDFVVSGRAGPAPG